jgi:Zn-finger nucleic acid-binding protein
MKELCPKCKTELEHITKNNEDIFGCPKCKREIMFSQSIKYITLIEKMLFCYREASDYYIEARTEMENYTELQRTIFNWKASYYQHKGYRLYKWLIDIVGIDEQYLNELCENI